MLIYVAHKYGGESINVEHAKRKTHDLAVNDLENTYICPLCAFSFLEYKEIGYDEEMEMCIDLLSVCDKLIVASEVTDGVRREIEFARLVGMEVEYIA